MTEQELLNLKEEIEEAKQKTSELKGEKQALMKQLKSEWDCNSLEEADKKRQVKTTEREKISEKIENGMVELENKLNEDDS
jgi:predicted transcriptional regulator